VAMVLLALLVSLLPAGEGWGKGNLAKAFPIFVILAKAESSAFALRLSFARPLKSILTFARHPGVGRDPAPLLLPCARHSRESGNPF
jgi:hypothetical protein